MGQIATHLDQVVLDHGARALGDDGRVAVDDDPVVPDDVVPAVDEDGTAAGIDHEVLQTMACLPEDLRERLAGRERGKVPEAARPIALGGDEAYRGAGTAWRR